ncbi:alpha/beta hydrolase [Lacihabitans sp. LS3-19]|uniref:alpha/beta hydrolase n=1 Tax=Lacihabitans sp. LS3-19 TaxID=2487335 RepID=UPI0020CF06DB|nr:alpha/beta hydrolase [Lacihabitans sp. LS3-19]MCP9770510.1 alpha/beta hydrolase [Lacihabitans sp. LS3-19]
MKKSLFLIFSLVQITLFGQETIPLYSGLPPYSLAEAPKTANENSGNAGWMTKVIEPKLTVYLPEKSKNTGRAVVVCPGGGYTGLAIKHEGHDMAKKLQANGIAGFVLEYRLPFTEFIDSKNKEFVPLMDAQRAIQIVRENAEKWGINVNKVGIAGSSAGGHLASTAGTHYQKTLIPNPKNTSLRPDFMVLIYPVISFADSITHKGSRFNLVGELSLSEYKELTKDWQTAEKNVEKFRVDEAKILEYSNERHVTPDTSPTFITHAIDDKVVLVQNSLFFIAALQQNKVPVESFFYAKGGHGFGLDNPTATEEWIDKCLTWILNLK